MSVRSSHVRVDSAVLPERRKYGVRGPKTALSCSCWALARPHVLVGPRTCREIGTRSSHQLVVTIYACLNACDRLDENTCITLRRDEFHFSYRYRTLGRLCPSYRPRHAACGAHTRIRWQLAFIAARAHGRQQCCDAVDISVDGSRRAQCRGWWVAAERDGDRYRKRR